MTPSNARRQRQLDQLRELCTRGAIDRAIDLAFEHFAAFGQDESVVVLLEVACRDRCVCPTVRDRLESLRAARS